MIMISKIANSINSYKEENCREPSFIILPKRDYNFLKSFYSTESTARDIYNLKIMGCMVLGLATINSPIVLDEEEFSEFIQNNLLDHFDTYEE